MAVANSGFFYPKGDCKTDDTAAIQSMLNMQRWMFLDKPAGGCYLVSKTLVLLPGSYLYGQSANNPNYLDAAAGVVIRLAPNTNTSLLRTIDSYAPPGSGNEYMALENIVFDGNGSQQTAELKGAALVDYRGTFIQTFLRHVVITNSFGPALYTGSTELDNLWIIATTTSDHAWVHNPGQTGFGALSVNQVYVEETMKPLGGRYNSPWSGGVNDPSQYGHAILFNGLQSATINQLHCESAATCLDFNDIQTLTIHGISGTRIGNPMSADITDQYLMRALNTNIGNFTFSAAYFDQSGSQYTGAFPNSRVFGLANGLQTNDIMETAVGRTVWPFYTWGQVNQGYTGAPFLGERPIVANELFIQQVGNYSPNRLNFFDGPWETSTYSFIERNGPSLKLGYSPGPLNVAEQAMFSVNWFGVNNPSNSVQVDEGRLQTGRQENTDLVGKLSVSSEQYVMYPFAHSYAVSPVCTVTPEFDLGSGNRLWVTYSGSSSFEVHFSSPVSGELSYHCIGRS